VRRMVVKEELWGLKDQTESGGQLEGMRLATMLSHVQLTAVPVSRQISRTAMDRQLSCVKSPDLDSESGCAVRACPTSALEREHT
jgi:hypothetical protein